MVELLGVGQLQVVLHVGVVAHTCGPDDSKTVIFNFLFCFSCLFLGFTVSSKGQVNVTLKHKKKKINQIDTQHRAEMSITGQRFLPQTAALKICGDTDSKCFEAEQFGTTQILLGKSARLMRPKKAAEMRN